MEETKNLIEGLLDEITRVTEMIVEYEALPKGAGNLAASIMRFNVRNAKNSISKGDTIGMMYSYEELKKFEDT